MERYLRKKVLFFGGKGGVGKTTTAAAFALGAARRGKRCLLVSTDPAHNLGHIFEKRLRKDRITSLLPGLSLFEIDAHEESHRYLKQVSATIRKVVRPDLMPEMERQISLTAHSPGALEAALFDRLTSLLLEESGDYDLLIFDTAPTGHTLQLLTLPESMELWINGLLKRRDKSKEMYTLLKESEGGDGEANRKENGKPDEEKRGEDFPEEGGDGDEDPVRSVLMKRKAKFAGAREILTDPERTAFLFVTIPEEIPIRETLEAVGLLKKHGIPVQGLFVNRILPENSPDPFFSGRKEQERIYLKKIRHEFKKIPLHYLPMLERDVYGLSMLEKSEELLFRETRA